MSGLMKKHPIKKWENMTITIRHDGIIYIFPKNIAEKFRVSFDTQTVDSDSLFKNINQKYSKPGALLRGIRIRENLTQAELAKKIKVTQSDISQMESGTRNIGRIVAKRIEKLFHVDYKSFLA